MFKKYFKYILLVILVMPIWVEADLEDKYYVQDIGTTSPLYADYTWYSSTFEKEFYSKDEINSDMVCTLTDYYRWTQTQVSCSINNAKLDGVACYSGTKTGVKDTENAAKLVCMNNIGKLTCTTRKGAKTTITASFNNTSFSNIRTHSVISKISPGSSWKRDAQLYSCGGKVTNVSAKSLVQNVYKTSSGAEAYCVHPGQTFVAQNYVKMKSVDTSNCKKSNESYACALVAVIIKSQNNDYLTTLTALRFISAKYGRADGWWDSHEKTVFKANVYNNTINAIQSSSYNGGTSSSGLGIIYADGNSSSSLSNAINIYKQVTAGFDMWAPKSEVIKKEYKDNTLILNVGTNLESIGNIKKIILDTGSGSKEVNYSTTSCSKSDYNLCLEVKIELTLEEMGSCGNFKLKITYQKEGDIISKVGLYEAESNGGSYQNMYIFDRNAESVIELDKLCADVATCDIVDGKYYGINGTEVSKEQYEKECGGGGDKCPNDGKPDNNVPTDCQSGGTSGTYEDKEMCTVLNSSDNVKQKYKEETYGTTYGGGYCEVYCRESIYFEFMDIEEAKAGTYFKHDVGGKGQNYSTLIKSTRQCASEIDYDKWLEDYRFTNESLINLWNEYKKWETNAKYEEEYDNGTATCSGCSTSCFDYYDPDEGISHYKSVYCSGTGATYNLKRVTTNGSHNYKMANSRVIDYENYIGANVSNPLTSTSYEDEDTFSQSCSCSGSINCDFKALESAKTKASAAKAAYEAKKQKRDNLIKYIKNCNFFAGTATYNDIMQYNTGDQIDISYDETYMNKSYNDLLSHPSGKDSTPVTATVKYGQENEWEKYCGNCYGEPSGLGASVNKQLVKYICNGSETSAYCKNEPEDIPTNKFAMINATGETYHYQANTIYTQVFSGEVANYSTSQGYWINLGNKLYPVSPNTITGLYPLYVDYSNIGSVTRKLSKFNDGSYTCYYRVINELNVYDCDDGYHKCYDCDTSSDKECYDNTDGNRKRTTLGVYYRTISLSDMFPESQYSPKVSGQASQVVRNIGSNWASNSLVINDIQNNGDDVWANVEPQYKVVLTPNILRKIKEYNKSVNYDYLDYSIECDSNLRCTSNFLDETLNRFIREENGTTIFYKSDISNNSLYYYQYVR